MSTPKADIPASIDFLHNWRPQGPWVLFAITPEQKGFASETFSPGDEAKIAAWIEPRLGKDNIYFTVNPLLKPMTGYEKAKKIDVKSLAWLHVDLDPRPAEPGIDLAEHNTRERERALRLLREFSPPPTVIVDSGGGYQGFWRLTEEQPINGDETRAIELEAYNIQLEVLLGADACHNSDRIMRLPGTLNVPNEKKRKKGRKLALASVVEDNWELVYPISAFTRAPRLQTGRDAIAPGPAVKLSGNLPKISLDDLPEAVSLRTRMLIVQGDDPDDPAKYRSRSEACWAVCCELVRGGCSDDQIASIILDRDFGISGHVLAQGRPQDYAARQIRRAREEAIHPRLRQLNELHAIIENYGGKCRVIEEMSDPNLKRSRLSLQGFDDFRNRYMHILVDMGLDPKGEMVRMQLGKYWLTNPNRRQYRTLVFSPGREVPDSYNLWRGFACEARPGKCDLFLDHVKQNICDGNSEHYEYLMNWMARAVQNPDSPGEVATVLRGKMGTGKGKFIKVFGSLWGRHFLHVSNSKHLVGQFNSHLRDCVVLFGDEAFFAGDKSHESMLKTLITEEILMVEAKGVDAEPTANYVHLLLASNADWVVPTSADDRRFFVLDVGASKAQDPVYFSAIDEEVENGGREALLHMLMTRNISNFEVRNVPKTKALTDQKIQSMGSIEEWWYEKLIDGKIGKNDGWPEEISKDDLVHDLNRYFERQKIMRRPSPTALGRFLSKVMDTPFPISYQKMADISFDDGYGQTRTKRARTFFFKIANLDTVRSHWDHRTTSSTRWLEPLNEVFEEETKPPF